MVELDMGNGKVMEPMMGDIIWGEIGGSLGERLVEDCPKKASRGVRSGTSLFGYYYY